MTRANVEVAVDEFGDDGTEMLVSIRQLLKDRRRNAPLMLTAIDLLRLLILHAQTMKGLTGREKLSAVVRMVEEVAKGADGVAGTDDDLVPVPVVTALRAMVEHGILAATVSAIVDAAKGSFLGAGFCRRSLLLGWWCGGGSARQ